MSAALQRVKRVFFVAYIVGLHIALAYLVGERALRNYTTIMPVDETSVKDPLPDTVVPTPPPVPESFADAGINDQATPFTQRSPGLIIPVVGVTPDQLIDTFSSSRSEDRFHDAIDIAAPAGTPVVAATDGEIIKFFDSERGGITIYQLTADRRFVLYYAHLQKRADELQIGMKVTQGATIGFVGDTGNVGAGNYHLHFSIAMVTDPKRAWEGIYINPYPLLRDGTYPQAP